MTKPRRIVAVALLVYCVLPARSIPAQTLNLTNIPAEDRETVKRLSSEIGGG